MVLWFWMMSWDGPCHLAVSHPFNALCKMWFNADYKKSFLQWEGYNSLARRTKRKLASIESYSGHYVGSMIFSLPMSCFTGEISTRSHGNTFNTGTHPWLIISSSRQATLKMFALPCHGRYWWSLNFLFSSDLRQFASTQMLPHFLSIFNLLISIVSNSYQNS